MDAAKDWTGNSKSTFTCLGASNHSESIRPEGDYYATDPRMAKELLKLEPALANIWEPACGAGHLAKIFSDAGNLGKASDLYDRGYGVTGVDFLKTTEKWMGDIVTNPPYKYAKEFAEHALSLIPAGRKVCLFLKLTFLEGKSRAAFFRANPPKTLYVSASRAQCARNGDFAAYAATSSAAAYGWYVWEKGYTGSPEIKWFNY